MFLVNDSARVLARDLPDVVPMLWEEVGCPPVLVATGTHTGSVAQHRDRLGGIPLDLHDADDADAHVAINDSHPARIDRRVADADLVVAFGSVEPHYFGGWTGAHKTATVGVLDRESITRNHAHAVKAEARPCALEGNPVFDDLAQILTALEGDRRVLAVNHVIDASGAPLGLGVGTWRGSLERCLDVARQRFVRQVEHPVDVLVASVEGVLARTLYQADKGLKNNEAVVKDGGDLILCAKLGGGVGPDRFLQFLADGPGDDYVLGDHKAIRWRALEARGVRIRIASPDLDPAAVAGAGLELHPSLKAALDAIRADDRGARGVGLVVQDAGYVVTEVAPGRA